MGYSEETYKTYSGRGKELYDFQRASCNALFVDTPYDNEACYVSSTQLGTYSCSGCIQCNRRHAY